MASKRKLSNVVDDEEVKRRKIDEGGENNDEIELYKYHHFLPEHLKPDIKNEIVEYKHEIFTKLRQFYILLHSSTSPLTADQWQVLEHVLTLLRRYNELHYPFSKKEKEELCTKIFNILTYNEGASVVDFYTQASCCIAISNLIKKKEKLDLVFEWRRLYNILENTYFQKFRKAIYTPKDHGSSIVDLVRKIKRYFPPDASEEIWRELRPTLCMHDHLLFKAQGFLCLFLPTTSPNITWIDEMMSIWSWISMHPTWDHSFMTLLSEMAEEQVGKIDWEPYMPFIFTRLLAAFDVPVGGSPSYLYDEYPMSECSLFASFDYAKNLVVAHAAKFIIWSLSPNGSTLDRLKKLLRSTESYYHPSNEGSWTGPIGDFLLVLCSIFGNRLNKEHKKKKPIPESYKLTDKIIKEFVQTVLPVAMKAMYSKSSQMTSCANHSLKFMAYLAPDVVFPPLMETCFHALQTLTETHQTVSALETLSLVIFPLLKQSHYPDGAKYLTELMNLTLPGIDTNDMRKTYCTLKFYKSLLVCLPLFSDHINSDVMTDDNVIEDKKLPEAVQFFEDWCIQFLDRIFVMLSHQSPPKKDSSNSGDTISPSMFWSICDLFFNQLSPGLHDRCLKKVFNFLNSEFLINAKKNIGHMCSAISFSDPKNTLDLFVPMCYDRLVDKNGKLKHLTESETQWYVHIMSKVLLLSGADILSYKDKILQVIELTYQSEEKKILKSGGKLIKNVLRSLTAHYALDIRSVNPEIWHSPEFKTGHYKYWSEFPTLDEMTVKWHVPTNEEILLAIEIVNRFIKQPYEVVKGYISELASKSDKISAKKKVKHAMVFIGYIIRGADSLFPEIEDEVIEGYERFADSRRINAGLCLADQAKDKQSLQYTFKDLSLLCHELCQSILIHKKEEDPALLGLITKLLYPIICKRGGITQLRYKQKRDNHEVIKLQSYKDVFSMRGQKYPRYLLVSRAVLEYKLRCVLHNEALSFTKTHELLLDDLAQLALSSYSIVRKKAQRVLFATFGKFAEKVVLKYLPRFMDALKNTTSTDDERTGAIYCLEKYASVKNVIRNWDMMHRFLITISQTSHIEKQTVQERLAALYDTYFSAFYHVAITKENIGQYNNLVLSLVDLVESNKNMHWKYQTLVTSFLMLMIRSDQAIVPTPVATYFFRQMISDIDKIRHISVESIELILCQYKPVQMKKKVSFSDNHSFLVSNKWRDISYPSSNQEWDKADFFEKNYFGWYTCPQTKEIEIYDYSSRNPVDKLKDQRNLLIEEYNKIMTDEFVKKLFETMVIREDTFSEANAQMFKGMFQIFKQSFLDKCKPHFEGLLTRAGSGKQEEAHYMSLSAEFVSGLIRGMKHWEYDLQDQTYQYLFPLLDKVLQDTSMNCVGEWCECFEFAVCDRDPRRIKWIKDYMFDKFEKMIGNIDDTKIGFQSSSSNQVRYLRYLYGIIGETSWRDPDTLDRLLSILKKHLAHPYEQVRECISIFLSMIFKTLWRPARNDQNLTVFNQHMPVPQNVKDFVEFVKEQYEVKLKTLNDLNDKNFILNGTNDPAERTSPEATDMKALSKTVMNWSNSLFSSYSPHCGVQFATDFINILAKIHGNSTSEDEDVQGLAADNLITISAYAFTEPQAVTVLNYLNDTLHHSNTSVTFTNWRVRQCLLEFIQVFGFREQFYLGNEQDKLIELILSLLKDPQLEVRECACTTLAGFIKISELKYIELLTARFRKWVTGDSVLPGKKQSRQKRKRSSISSLQSSRATPVNESDALLKHSGVLGLSAIVKAFPYTLPDYLPPVLVQLAQFSNDHSQPIRDSTRKTFAEFWKQHGDLWHIQKKKLTENQLQILNSLLISPSYYA